MITESIDKKEQNVVFLYTTCADREEARKIGMAAVDERLAICADFWAVESLYPWNGVLQEVNQYMLVLTTQKLLGEKLALFVRGLHSYSIPMVTITETKFTDATYLDWGNRVLNDTDTLRSFEEEFEKTQGEDDDGYHPGKLK